MSLITRSTSLHGWQHLELGRSGYTQTTPARLGVPVLRWLWFVARHPSVILPLLPVLVASAVLLVVGLRGLAWMVAGLTCLSAGMVAAAAHRGQLHHLRIALLSPWRWWWARWVVYGWLWPRLALQCRLSVQDHASGEIRTPTVTGVRLTAAGEHVQLRLPIGMSPEEVTRKAELLAHALGTTRPLRVRVESAGQVSMLVQRRDPLAATVAPIPPAPSAGVELLRAVPIGKTEAGQTWQVPVWGSHIFCGGLTGSGKGSILWSLLHGMAPFIRDGIVQVWAVDPKGGMELEQGASLFTRFERDDLEAMATLLEDAAAAMDARCRQVRGHTRLVTPTKEMPLVVVIMDELASLTSLCLDRKIGIRVERALGLLATKGRAPGFCLVAFSQEVSKETARWRDLFPTKIALRLAKGIEVDMVLGDGAWQAGAHAGIISPQVPGSGYALEETTSTPIAVRASWLDDHAIESLVTTYAPQQMPLELPELEPLPDQAPQPAPVQQPKPRKRSPRQSTRDKALTLPEQQQVDRPLAAQSS